MQKTLILYNGRCPICATEIGHYRRRAAKHTAPLEFRDFHDEDLAQWALDPDQAARRLHARLPDGSQVSGIEAFAEIWQHLPRLRWAARLVRLPAIRPLARLIYDSIAAPALYHLHKRRQRLGTARPRA